MIKIYYMKYFQKHPDKKVADEVKNRFFIEAKR